MVKIIDNFFEPAVNETLNKMVLDSPMYYGHSSAPGTDKFLTTHFNLKDPFIDLCINIIQKKCERKFHCFNVYTNIQFNNMEGGWHVDNNDLTILHMTSETLPENQGIFEMKDGEKVNFVNNRVIMFNGHLLHRGHAPLGKNIRMTTAFKTNYL